MNAPVPHNAVAVAALPVAHIGPSPSNPRKHVDEDYIAELAESIKAHGVIQPITVRPNPRGLKPLYEIVVGECRWRAAKIAGLTEIPAFWRELDDRQTLEIQVIENLQRRDVHPIEEAEGYEALMQQHGYKAEEIAKKIGKSRAYVYARLKLTALCPEAREAFFAGKLDASTALLVARIPGAALQQRAVKEITHGYDGQPLSFRNAKNHIRHHFTVSLKQATFSLDDAALVPAAGSCADCPKRSGNAPELCADLEDADVCTDTQCFEDKRLARRQQLLERAEKKGIPIYTGDKAREIAPYGRNSLDPGKFVELDDVVPGDGQERTYRDILGDQAPVAAVLEVGAGPRQQLVELGEPTALERALKKAGWQPAEDREAELAAARARDAARAEREREAAAREERMRAKEAEIAWRERVLAASLGALESAAAGRAITALAIAWLRYEATISTMPEDELTRFGLELPEEYDQEEELARLAGEIVAWPPERALALLYTAFCREDFHLPWNWPENAGTPHNLLDLAGLAGIDPESLREPAPDPTPAAQAQGESAPAAKPKGKRKGAAKKAGGEANPAPASPANEPAAPAEKPGAAPAWPFRAEASA
ncbi:MAG: ParB/RepB/Spo0J family partition protein [Pseudomonadota bacterium]